MAHHPFVAAEEEMMSPVLMHFGLEGDDPSDVSGFQDVTDGFDFLRRARKEASQLDDVVVAPNIEEIRDKFKLKKTSDYVDRQKVFGIPQKFIPTRQWQMRKVKEFSDLRMKLGHNRAKRTPSAKQKPNFPNRSDEKGWCVFLYGTEMWDKITEFRKALDEVDQTETETESSTKSSESGSEDYESAEEINPSDTIQENSESSEITYDVQNPPKVSIISFMRPNVIEKLLLFHIGWCEDLKEVLTEFGTWIYALMSRLEKPLYPDTQSALRSLAILCSQNRQKIIEKSQEEEEKLQIVNTLSLFICLVAKYFDQNDLSD